ncbi:hypothetical protein QFZ37_000042 [Chryseobacterium ginsenosidimutans]|uniref:hypothetical protein n=1 Tax=Chryseobacterium ginsenosidimutans TaxID=687846 RepID=UPI00277DE427|nr:hypothetical protein [Chryseobacterium ginsenosidimutans]MDQ0591673.1 hypothetical protein [Chryseobacterium ginsenosidimutans]
MKKSLLLIPLIIIACKKDPGVLETENKDSIAVSEQPASTERPDSAALKMKDSIINNAPKTKEVLQKGVMRSVKDGQIIRTVDAEQFPLTLGEEFTKDGQEFILKITDFEKPTLKAKISTKEKDFNIRFNQIKLPNGDYDGPFGRDITYEVKEKGEVWLIIGKSNMASGNTTGSFTVSVE